VVSDGEHHLAAGLPAFTELVGPTWLLERETSGIPAHGTAPAANDPPARSSTEIGPFSKVLPIEGEAGSHALEEIDGEDRTDD
jgi:hypothetical protein